MRYGGWRKKMRHWALGSATRRAGLMLILINGVVVVVVVPVATNGKLSPLVVAVI